ncbi:Adaptin N terminal region family protein [Tritrichomonas foetus]|uniref:AP-1 complex subunit gamma n=1 Tax=Tritrichomonas foetus TaxID=1144522 RepID=A0A1J4L4C1_9EUKA|nr:Adaptin N terminal region family protein [Tritrichomonas foetus]|eukprot:OHT16790.1 Adaptin N terminal region family protein [Tritrichomonas foetus]
MTQELNEFISSVRLADSLEHERFLIKSEQADMRSYVRECDPTMRPRIVAKLLFLNILGENVSYGQMEALTLMSQDRFSYKRIGYIAAAAILDEASEMTVLITHTITKDLESNDPRIQCLALAFIANLGSTEMCQAVATHVIKLGESNHPNVMKRSAMAGCRIVQRVPDIADTFKGTVSRLLKQGAHGVVISAINLMSNLIEAQPNLKTYWTRYAAAFTKILRQLNQSKASREFAFTVFNDPFLQVRLMKILSVLKKPSDDLDDVLESIATGVDIRRNSGRALLFQAVETIVSTAKKASLRGLAFSQIGRLFHFKEANVVYSALSVYSHVLYQGNEIVGRTTGDSIALQRYKTNVVHLLSHRDSSIRRRALDVVSALVDETNVESLIPEVLDYVKLADSEFRVELVGKIFTAIQRFAPNPKWNFDMVHRILIDNGNYVGSDIITNFCKLISKSPDLQSHAVHQLSASMLNFSDTQSLMQVTAWVLGEFMIRDDGGFDNLKTLMKMPQTTGQTKGYIITALGKLSVRFNRREELIAFLKPLETSANLDVQQRAGEISAIVAMPDVCEDILTSIDATDSQQNATTLVVDNKEEHEDDNDLLLILDSPNKNATNTTNPNSNQNTNNSNTFDVLGDFSITNQSNNSLNNNNNSKSESNSGKSAMDDLLSLDVSPVSNNPNNLMNGQNDKEIKPPPGAVEALRTPDYVIYFEIRKNPQNQKQIAIRASVFNLGNIALNNFSIKYGVPYGWMLQTQPPTATKLDPIGGKPIFQQLMVYTQTNTPLMMKTQINYVYGSQPIVENGEINPIFN